LRRSGGDFVEPYRFVSWAKTIVRFSGFFSGVAGGKAPLDSAFWSSWALKLSLSKAGNRRVQANAYLARGYANHFAYRFGLRMVLRSGNDIEPMA
jgi:hypothetical protein